jgi:uncharacterized protein
VAAIFLDPSALVRRYDRSEAGSALVRAACSQSRGNVLIIARHATVEVASALARKRRDGIHDPRAVAKLWRTFQAHVRDQYRVIEVTDMVYSQAERLVFAHALRAFDAVHVGCALVIAVESPHTPVQFWTADRRQAGAASAEGLDVRLVD